MHFPVLSYTRHSSLSQHMQPGMERVAPADCFSDEAVFTLMPSLNFAISFPLSSTIAVPSSEIFRFSTSPPATEDFVSSFFASASEPCAFDFSDSFF
jgi:hypothetical protein